MEKFLFLTTCFYLASSAGYSFFKEEKATFFLFLGICAVSVYVFSEFMRANGKYGTALESLAPLTAFQIQTLFTLYLAGGLILIVNATWHFRKRK